MANDVMRIASGRLDATDVRPVGRCVPQHEPTAKVLAAIEAGNLADGQRLIDQLPELQPADLPWKRLLSGLVSLDRGQLAEAAPCFTEACSLAFAASLSASGAAEKAMLRLAARAMLHLGWLYRRQERASEASRVHEAAFGLYKMCGSHEELWEVATELARDADLAEPKEESERWHQVAIQAAARVADAPNCKEAIAWTNLSTSLMGRDDHEAAVSAARTARQRWRDHDISAVTAALADFKLGHALLQLGQCLHEAEPGRANPALSDALDQLREARDSLEAFGPTVGVEVKTCRAQIDFAERLLASLPAE